MKIKYWDKSVSDIKRISDERDIKVGYFKNCVIEGHSIHYPQPLIKTGDELLLPTIERFMSLGRGTVYESDMEWECKNANINKIETTPDVSSINSDEPMITVPVKWLEKVLCQR